MNRILLQQYIRLCKHGQRKFYHDFAYRILSLKMKSRKYVAIFRLTATYNGMQNALIYLTITLTPNIKPNGYIAKGQIITLIDIVCRTDAIILAYCGMF